WYQLSALQERFRSTEQLASERLRHLSATADDERPGRDPDQLAAEAEKIRAQETALREALQADQAHLAEAVHRRQGLERQLAESEGLDEEDAELVERHTAAQQALDVAQAREKELADAERQAEMESSEWGAREEALALGLRRKDGAGTLLAAGDRVPGLLGSVAALLAVEPGHEAALAAALGALADAVAVSTVDDVTAAVRLLKEQDAGRATLFVASPGVLTDRPALPDGARWVLDVVRCSDSVRPALERALGDVVLAADLD